MWALVLGTDVRPRLVAILGILGRDKMNLKCSLTALTTASRELRKAKSLSSRSM